MLKMLRVRRGEKGFTLIELLIVVAIIGILAAVAIPQFSAYRIRGYNSAGHSDGKNVVTSQEAYFVDNQKYLTVAAQVGPGAVVNLVGAKLSKNVKARAEASDPATAGGSYYATATAHSQGDKVYGFESGLGIWKANTKVAGETWDDTVHVVDATTLAGAGWSSL